MTLMDSAQCFHWVESSGMFGGMIAGECCWLSQNDDGVCYAGGNENDIIDYLDLSRDYSLLADEVKMYPEAQKAIREFSGIRVLNQPVWEALISFIISANNNVGRIKGIVSRLLTAYGDKHDTEFGPLYSFPAPERLAECTVSEMHDLGLGYRDRYIVETSKLVADGFDLDILSKLDYEEAHKRLVSLPGVGDKVADCVLLFGCRHSESFPVDVWVERMCRAVFSMDAPNRKAMAAQARHLLGKDAGLIQQYLFHASRLGYLEV